MASSAHQLTTTSQHTSVSVVAPLVDYRYAQCLEKNSQNVFNGPPPSSIHNAKNYLINKILLWNCGICDESRASSSAQIMPAHVGLTSQPHGCFLRHGYSSKSQNFMNLRKAQLPKKIRSIWMTSSNFLFVLFLFTILIAQADGNGELYSKNNPTVQGLAGAASVVISPDGNYVYAVTKAKTIPTAVLGSLHWWHRNAATGDLTYKGKISPNDENTGKACFDQGSIAVSPDQMIYTLGLHRLCAWKREEVVMNVPETSRSYSSYFDTTHKQSMLDSPRAWSPGFRKRKAGSWMQMDLGSSKQVTGVITQPRRWSSLPTRCRTTTSTCNQYVKTFTVKYSTDNSQFTTMPGTYTNACCDNDKTTSMFPSPVTARYIRIVVQTWNGNDVALRAGVVVVNSVNLKIQTIGPEGIWYSLSGVATASAMSTGSTVSSVYVIGTNVTHPSGRVYMYNTNNWLTYKAKKSKAELKSVCGVVISSDGKHIYAVTPGSLGSPNGKMIRYQRYAMTGTSELGDIKITERTDLANAKSVTISPDGKSVYVVASTSSTGSILRWDRHSFTGYLTWRKTVTGIVGATTVTVTPDNTKVFVGASNAQGPCVIYWDRDTSTGALSDQMVETVSDLQGDISVAVTGTSDDTLSVIAVGSDDSSSAIVTWKFSSHPICPDLQTPPSGKTSLTVKIQASCALVTTVQAGGDYSLKQLEVIGLVTPKITERAPGVGGWGGSCTCPNGQVYQTGDNEDACNSLACVGGIAGPCQKTDGVWSNRKVNCNNPILEMKASDSAHFISHPGGSLRLVGLNLRKGSGTKGGSISVIGSTDMLAHLTVLSCILNGAGISLNSGALIYVGEASVVNITNSELKNGVAGNGNGGALFISGASQNVGTHDHGSHPPLINIVSSLFADNEANGGSGGGAVYIAWNANVNIISSTFQNNKAKHAGALFVDTQVNLNINNTLFKDNSASKYHGGAVFAYKKNTITIQGTTFVGNIARQWGGGILVKDETTLNMNGGRNEFKGNSDQRNCHSICRRGDQGDGQPTAITSTVHFNVCPPNKYYDGSLLPIGPQQHKSISNDFVGCPKSCSATQRHVAIGFKFRTDNVESNVCKNCNAGTVFCEDCDDNGITDEYASCRPCELGRVASPGATDCVHCLNDPDKFQDEVGESTCKLCPAGWTADDIDATKCYECAAGMYISMDFGITPRRKCVTCPKGTYNNFTAALNVSYCLKCTPGRYLPEQATQAQDHDELEDCLNCTANTYSPSYGAGMCYRCLESTPSGAASCPGACSGKCYHQFLFHLIFFNIGIFQSVLIWAVNEILKYFL